MLALDPPGDPTIGACLAADASGPRRHRYGAMRDLVIGVTVVLPGGLVASSGGKVVKNVAGYDIGKLFSGSRGRLGLIARVALRLHPRPPTEATVVAETDDPRALWQELIRLQLEPSAVDLLPGKVALLFEGPHAAVETQAAAAPGELADAAIWAESARAQLEATARIPHEWQDCLLARPGPGHAYLADGAPRPWSPLAQRVRASFDPEGILV
jgi:glycolate oxidase FAD binding subunit